jgi:hypothetical protein
LANFSPWLLQPWETGAFSASSVKQVRMFLFF